MKFGRLRRCNLVTAVYFERRLDVLSSGLIPLVLLLTPAAATTAAPADAAELGLSGALFSGVGGERSGLDLDVQSIPLPTGATNKYTKAGPNRSNFLTSVLPPDAPINALAKAADGSIVISFLPPISSGGSPIVSYRATCAGGGDLRTVIGPTSPLTITGAKNGSAYTCSVAANNAFFAGDTTLAAPAVPSPPPSRSNFAGSILLGAPTSSAITANIYSTTQSGTVSIAYGASSGRYEQRTSNATLAADTPLEIELTGLLPNTRYFYRLNFQDTSGGAAGSTDEYTFQTARPPGSKFVFTIQADSHMDENSDLNQYQRTLANVLSDAPDFHIDLGDTFMTEKHAEPLSATSLPAQSQAITDTRYEYERGNFGQISHSVPLFLVNGNHEGEAGWLNVGSSDNLAVWSTNSRQKYFVNPTPGAFYSGDASTLPAASRRDSWYAWTWGDALFVVLDPFWYSTVKTNNTGWALTLGATQFRWLEATLAASPSRYKFVFLHNLVGGLDGQMRGGIEAAPFYEWGGLNADRTPGFATQRPGWSMPIHDMLKKYRVSAVFHGHDHVYVNQDLDGIVYQEVPQPSARNTSSGASIATEYRYASGTVISSAGHIRVIVSPQQAVVQYVRAILPAAETTQRKNGAIDHSWTVPVR